MFVSFSSAWKYLKKYRNPLCVITKVLRHKYPFFLRTRDNISYEIFGHMQVYTLAAADEYVVYNPEDELLRFRFKDKDLVFSDGLNNGALFDVFFDVSYGSLDVRGRDVIDIGANIGDSCVYFAVSGARRVIAFEPHDRSYRAAQNNVMLNGLSGRIEIHRAAVGSVHGEKNIMQPLNADGGSSLKENVSGMRVQVFTLDKLVKEFQISGGVLKIDCEGCEYEVIESTQPHTLRHFDQIIVEYHYGKKRIINSLIDAGFHIVEIKRGLVGLGTKSRLKLMRTGVIFAVKDTVVPHIGCRNRR